jgi:fused signal recognition particle receptor
VFGRDQGLRQGLTKTRQSFFGRIANLLRDQQITEDHWDELEALLVQADVGVNTTMALVETMREAAASGEARTPDELQKILKDELVTILRRVERKYLFGRRNPNVVLVVGVNGSGKTTSIAKLARYHKDRGQKVLLAAADTFRAAAIDQLKAWGDRAGVEVIAHQPGADPGAVAFDAVQAARSRGVDVVLVDTAGRLHTKYNLMQELTKIRQVLQRQTPGAPHETLLVLDATTGQNAMAQARTFKEAVNLTGIVMAKLDSTSKGGVVFAIANDLNLPVLFAATGEKMEDWAEFNARQYVEGLF